MPWEPKKKKWDWRSALTEQEAADVQAAERKAARARQVLAEASLVIGPIRTRAMQRVIYADRKAAP